MAILRISDGTTTLNLLNSTNYKAAANGLSISPPRSRVAWGARSLLRDGAELIASSYENRRINVSFHIFGSSLTDFQTRVRAIHRLLNDAKQRQILGYGAVVYLEFQLGDAAGASTFFDILSGELVLPSTFLSTNLFNNFDAIQAELKLTCTPLGRYTNQAVSQAVLENEQDGASLNYMDIVTDEAYGDVPAKMYIKIVQANAGGSDKIWVAKRSGSRYDDNLWIQGEDEASSTDAGFAGETITFSDQADAALSGGEYRRTEIDATGIPDGSQHVMARHNYDIATLPEGTFRVLVYVRVTENSLYEWERLFWGMGWEYGNRSFTPSFAAGDYVAGSADTTWEILDLGLITIPPVGKSDIAGDSTLQLRIFQFINGDGWGGDGDTTNCYMDLDYIFLLPVDEGVVIVDAVPSTDRLAIDSISEPNGVFIMDSSDKIIDAPDFVGRPFSLGRETTRIYMLRSDGKTVTFTVDITYQPQFLVV